MLKLKFDELIQKAAVSGFYVFFVEDMILLRFGDNRAFAIIMNFFVEILGKTIAEAMAKIIWNTLIDWSKKQLDVKLEGKLIKKADVQYIPILMSNIISATFRIP